MLSASRTVSRAGMGPFSLFVISLSAAVVVSLSTLVVNSSLSDGPSIIASKSRFNFESWVSKLRGDLPRNLAKEHFNSQVHYVTSIINTKFKRDDAHELARLIVSESESAKVDPLFVASVIKSESAFKNHAQSHKGAMGLMQLMPETGEYISARANVQWKGSSVLVNPKYNIRLGVAYIKYLHEMFRGNTEHVLVAYNWGPGNLIQALKFRNSIPSSTVKYARTIIGNHRKWRSDFSARRAELDLARAKASVVS